MSDGYETATGSIAEAQLPTRAEFFATGLVPTKLEEYFECSISLCQPDEPVRLPCGHVFDKPCIVQNLSQRRVNTCPLCRKKLSVLPTDESLRPNAGRQALVAQAVQTVYANVGQEGAVFGDEEITASAMARGVANARAYLVHTPDAADGQAVGPGLIRPGYLAPRIVAMSALIPAMAAVSGRPYDSIQYARWSNIIDMVREDIDEREGKPLPDAGYLPRQIRAAIRQDFKDARRDWRQDPFATVEISPLTQDFRTMLAYIAQCCVDDKREQDYRLRLQAQAQASQRAL